MRRALTLTFLLSSLAAIACADADKGDRKCASNVGDVSVDPGPQTCNSCLPAEGLPKLGEVAVTAYPVSTNPCGASGVCVRVGDTPAGTCISGPNAGQSCDYRAGGYAPEDVDPELASEPFVIQRAEDCKTPNCDCDKTTCQGTGTPFFKESHVMVPTEGATRPELFVFLGGTGGNCGNHKWVTLMAATVGYRALCLSYVNDPSSLDYCISDMVTSPTTSCSNDFRRENIYGEDTSDRLQIGPRNSIVGRLKALIGNVAESEPDLGFDAYINGDDIAWDKIFISGFSQGGGNAGILSQDHEVARALFLSKGIGPSFHVLDGSCTDCADECPSSEAEVCQSGYCVRIEPAAYYTEPRATPASRSFGFVHQREDAMFQNPDAWVQWGMDLCGGLTSVEDFPDDYRCSHMLMTRAEPAGDSYHPSMASDGAMAKDADGMPLNQRVYMYLMTKE